MTTTKTDSKNPPVNPIKGAWYRVTGRRGNAKAAFGVEGSCIWVGDTYNQFNVITGKRVGLKPADSDTPVWVAATQITQIATPAAVAVAQAAGVEARLARPSFNGPVKNKIRRTHGAMVVILADGKHRGSRGEVFWRDEDKRLPGEFRVGVKTIDGETVWCGARDVVGPAEGYAMPTNESERALMFQQAEAMLFLLDGMGFGAEAIEWSQRALALNGMTFNTAVAL